MEDVLIVTITIVVNLIGVLIFGFTAPVCIAVMLLPFSDTNLIPRQMFGVTGANPFNITLGIAFSVFLLRWFKESIATRFPPIPPIFFVYVLMLVAGAVAGLQFIDQAPPVPSPQGMLIRMTPEKYLLDLLFKPLLIVSILFLTGVVACNDLGWKSILWGMSASLSCLSLVILSYITWSGVSLQVLADSRSRDFLGWIGLHANELGLLLNIGISLLFFAFLKATDRKSRILLAVSVGLIGISSLMTFSRAAFVGLSFILAYFLVSRHRFRELTVGLCILIGLLFVIPKEIYDRATTGFEKYDFHQISAGRIDRIWRPLASVVLESPIYGHGLGSTLWAEPNRKAKVALIGHPHSAYLTVLLDFGILGAAVTGLVFFSMWRTLRRLEHSHQDPMWKGFFEGGKVAILVLLLQGITDDRFVPGVTQSFLWIAFGLALGFRCQLKGSDDVDSKARLQTAICGPK